jgi:glycine/D-amino acid oxidase-like deaminating enzyme
VSPDVLVVGGGILGATSAAYLAREGASVVLVEAAQLAAGPSGRNLGLITGPHPSELRRIADRSLAAYLRLAEATGGSWIDADEVGCLYLSADGRDLPAEGDRLDADAIAEAEPLLAERFEAAVVLPTRRVDPAAAVAAWAEEARRRGAEVRTGCPIRALRLDGGRVTGAESDEGPMRAAHTVVATGWEAPRLVAPLGRDLGVTGVRGWLVTTRPAPFRLRRPLAEAAFKAALAAIAWPTVGDFAEGRRAVAASAAQVVQDAAGRVTLGSSLAASHGPADADGGLAVRAICRRAIELLPQLAAVPVAETRTCIRPGSLDGLPLLGPLDGLDGLVVACGHGGYGLTLGPGSGEAVANGILHSEWDQAFLPLRASA